MWGITVPIIGAVTQMHPAPAIVVKSPGGKPPNRVEAKQHLSNALTASSMAPVQDRACALGLLQSTPQTVARDVLSTGRDGSTLKQSLSSTQGPMAHRANVYPSPSPIPVLRPACGDMFSPAHWEKPWDQSRP